MRSLIFVVLLQLTSCAPEISLVSQKQSFSVDYHCNEADLCRMKEYGSASESEHFLCIDGMLIHVARAESKESRVMLIQQLECSLNDDPCDYLKCVSLHQDLFHRFVD